MNLAEQHPVILVAVPLFFAALCPWWGFWRRKLCLPWAMAGVALTGFFTWSLVGKVTPAKPVTYRLSGWAPPWGVQIRIDYVGLFMVCIITSMVFLLLVYSWKYVEREIPEQRVPYYYTLFLLIFTAMMGFCVTGDLFNMFVFMEIFSITSYALVAISGKREAVRAAFKYLLMGASSSLAVLMAIAFLYSATGSLNMLDISRRLMTTRYVSVAATALLFFTVGFAVKAALFPLHSWLPDAHSTAPSPVSALLSALVIKMGVIGLLRVYFTVYGRSFSHISPSWAHMAKALSWAAAIAIVVGSAMAIFQRDFKVMIAYSSIVHIGYIVLGISVLSVSGMTGGIFDVLAHAMGKGCFFLVAGAVIYKRGTRSIDDLRGIGATMPVTAGAFALASLSIVGIPPTAGFLAKWYVVYGCLDRRQYALMVLALLGGLLTAFYCFRIVYYMFFTGNRSSGFEEAPASMAGPTALLAAGTLFFGIFSTLVLPSLNAASRLLLK